MTSSCDSLEWNGTVYTISGLYTDTLQSVSSCDSLISIDLTINPTDDASFAYGLSSYCELSQDPTPVISGVTGGTFSSTTG